MKMEAKYKEKTTDEGIQQARKERRYNKMLINRFGKFLLEQMSGCVIHFEEQPSLDKIITEFFIPPDKYIPTKEGEFMIRFANGPTPRQINTDILREKCGGPQVPSPKEMYFRDKIARYLKQFQIIYDNIFRELYDKSFKKNQKFIRDQWKNKYLAITKRMNRETIVDKYDRSVQLLEVLQERKKQKIYDNIKQEKPLERQRVGNLQATKDFLTIFSGYKSKFDADMDEMSVIPLTEKIGKDAQKLIVKLYSVPYKQLKNMSRKILSGKHAIENCGYDKLFDSNKWLEESVGKEKELNRLINQINNDKLEVEELNSLVAENALKFEKWSIVLRKLLEEFQVIVSHIMKEQPQFAQYLPTFEKFFKTRAAWYIMNVRKEIPDDAIAGRKIDNKLITARIDENFSNKSGRKEKIKKPVEQVFTDGIAAVRENIDYANEANVFNSYLEEIIFAMKKLPNLWKSYVEYL